MKPAGGPAVFVIDDENDVPASIQSLLKSAGLRSETFALCARVLAHRAFDGPSCLVLDVSLPRVSGLDLQHYLADAGVQIPVIFITG